MSNWSQRSQISKLVCSRSGLENVQSIPVSIPLPQGSGSTSPSAPLTSLVTFFAALFPQAGEEGGRGVFRTQSAQFGWGERMCFWGHLVPGGTKG